MLTRGIYLLDTDTCIALLKKKPNVIKHLREVGVHNCKISDITIAELYFGDYKSGRQKHFDEVNEIASLSSLMASITSANTLKFAGNWNKRGKRLATWICSLPQQHSKKTLFASVFFDYGNEFMTSSIVA